MKKLMPVVFGLLLCALFAFGASAQDREAPQGPPEPIRQYVIACRADDFAAEVRKANEAGHTVNVVQDCEIVAERIVCTPDADE